MSFSRRGVLSRGLRSALALGFFTAAAGLAQAQSGTPIKLLVGFPAGGGTDAIARTLAEKLKDQLGTPVVVENRGGAGGQIAAQALKAAPADGHTLFLSHDHSISILPQVVKNPGFDPARDFVPVAGFATFANALAVSGATPAKSVNEYVAWVKNQRGGKDTIGVPAPASIPEFLVKLIGTKYKLDLQAAPYRGSAPMLADMLGNQISRGHRLDPRLHREPEGRQDPRRRGDRRQAPGRAAAGADLRRTRPRRPRGPALLRPVRAGGHAAAGDRPLRRSAGQGARHAGRARPPHCHGTRRSATCRRGSSPAACAATRRPGSRSSRPAALSRSKPAGFRHCCR